MTPLKVIQDKPGGESTRGHTRLETVMRCARRWYYRYVLRIRPARESSDTLEGRLMHLIFAWHYAAIMKRQGRTPPLWYTEEGIHAALAEMAGPRVDELRNARDVYQAYRRFSAGEPWQVVAVEYEIGATIRELWAMDRPGTTPPQDPAIDTLITTRLDLLIESNGGGWVVDNKFTKAHGWTNDTRDRLPRWNDHGQYALDWQSVLALRLARMEFGLDWVKGFVIQRGKRLAPHDFDRNPLTISPAVYHDAVDTCLAAARYEIAQLEVASRKEVPAGSFWACNDYGRPCDYRELCLAQPDARPELIQLQFRREEPK